MKKEKTNIMVYGLLKSGSSALVDLLRDYNKLSFVPGEFDDYRAPGLVADQLTSHHKKFPNLVRNISNFNGKVGIVYNIFPIFNFRKIINSSLRDRFYLSINKLKRFKLLKKLNRQLDSSSEIDKKIQYVKSWIKDVGNIYSENEKNIVYNQPIEVANEIRIWKQVFHPFKLIVVYRDPKDQLSDIIKFGYLYGAYNGPLMSLSGVTLETIYGRNWDGAIKFHIEAMKKRFEWIDILKKEVDPENFLLIDFEDLVYNYDYSKSSIEIFLGLNRNDNITHKSYFNPNNAKKSIGIYREYLSESERELLRELDDWYYTTKKNNTNLNSNCDK